MTGKVPRPLAPPLTRQVVALAALLLVALTGAPRPAWSQFAAPIPGIVEIELQGRVSVDSTRILRVFEVRPGAAYDPRALQGGLKKLWATGLFDDLAIYGRTDSAGVHLRIDVAERPHVATVEYTGLSKFKAVDLSKHLGFQPGDAWRDAYLATSRDSILAQYRKDGYRDATVRAEADSGTGGMRVTYAVTEGKKARITSTEIVGASAFKADDVRGKLASKKKGFPFRSGTVKEEKLVEDIENLRTFYRERGYRDIEVERLPFRPDPKGKGLVLSYKVDEGPLYRMSDVRWQGNEVVTAGALKSLPQPVVGAPYNATRIQQAVAGAYSLYAEEGYLYVSVEPTEIVRDSNTVDLAFQVSEGPPSHVRQVKITGNTYTKENVIRRELELHEGDLFRRSRLVNSQQNVFRLGYFGDVGVDFQPADSADVDVVLKIKEKQTGTAQAGAGYSSDGGLTGFLNLGHNNLFGNGQSVNIQLERGSRRRNVQLSFTDPWYHDTPLSLGGSAFSSQSDIGTNNLTEYAEKRRGFSFSVGRPIPGVRYTRGSAQYRLEGVAIDVTSLNPSPQLLALETRGEQVTSSIELGLTRNTTNNPFYPTRGQRGSISSQFAGGPLQGDFSYNQTRLDTRWYARSFLKRAAHMFRVRIGGVGAYTSGDSVPVYERFRLGGVTADGLRGYDDYSVVPKQNDTYPRYADGSSVSELSFARSRTPYPGGRFFSVLTIEEQFPIVNPVHAILFVEAGNVWNRFSDIRPFDMRKSAGFGFRVEIPVLGNVGFDYAYGFDKDRPGWKGHFLLGAALF
ncbi:MAG: outer membrane protein assembly factor BamA [Candidatus Eisenbacteria bacterium]